MKKVLITGKESYIGTHFKDYLNQYPNEYYVEELDVRDDSWKKFDFSKFDVVYHVAGIAHIKEKKENENLYFKVNRDLAYEIALKAKDSGVSQFIFMSSMSVYGLINSKTPITKNTKCRPNTFYGKSKFEAELLIQELNDNKFKVCILRPPMVYGENSPGNMSKLLDIVKKIHIFPKFANERSFITIERLIENIKNYIDFEKYGLFLPQEKKYLCTYEIIKKEMCNKDISIIFISVFNPIIRFYIGRNLTISKVFGNLKYDMEEK